MTVSSQTSRWRYLNTLVVTHKHREPEVLAPILHALAEEVLRSDATNRLEAGESILKSARTLEPMFGLKARNEWASFSFMRKLQEGFDAEGWRQKRTDELFAEGKRLVWP